MSAPTPLSSAQLHAIKHRGERAFPEFTWWLYLSMMGTATLVSLAWKIWSWSERRTRLKSPPSATRTGTVSLTRLPAALLTATRIVTLRWRIPHISMNVLEILLTLLYILLLFSLEFTSTNNLEIDFWANRTGHIVAIQYPLIVILSWKNNLISICTGISYEKLNLLHRVCSRVILMLVYVHLFGTLYNLGGAGGSQWFYAKWTYCGPISGFSLTLLIILSVSPIRKRFYEFFVKVHLVLVMMIMIATTIHVSLAPPGFGFYVWPAWVFWAFDRLCRYMRWFMLNDLVHPRKSSGQIELVTDDTLLFTIKRHIPFGWSAGQHAYLTLPTLGKLQSHPFTMATLPSGDKNDELNFIVRVRNGLTKQIKDHLLEFGPCETPMFIDGPYGLPPDITPFTTCVFIAGGSGISYTLPRLEELLNQVNAGDAVARRIVFVWVIRTRAHLKWISNRLAKIVSTAPNGVELVVNVHVTSGSAHVDELRESSEGGDVEKEASVEGEDSKSKAELEGLSDLIVIRQGRPDVPKVLEAEVAATAGSMSVDVAGPRSLQQDTRKALTGSFVGPGSVLRGTPTVQLNVEEFAM
ncbi:ferric reductase NAD binding domain-containing protein [Cristinia sonorae]|uniref:ferric-chelate reductase (NADPH) n=1 Tax=Cristinia sonorae TaxID=1940300 RepID=A0A8K0UGW2_9AGAR|nr:ferric reductase NAD binding domain-containing protein [Cristinia sonorae]